MTILKTLMVLSTLAVGIQFNSATPVEAGIFKNNRKARHNRSISARDHRQSRESRYTAREQRAIDRMGVEKFERRRAFWQAFAAGMAGAADGASNSLNTWNYSSPGSSTYLNSNLGNQMQWNSFNRNYSTNPDHAPVSGW